MYSLQPLYDKIEKTLLEDYFAFLKIPTVSTDPSYADDIIKGAEWVKNYLEKGQFEAKVWPTSTYPVVFGEYRGAGGDKPTLLIYGHYDVQPVDPIEAWDTPPFEPTIRNGQVYARGAQDNKGQILYTMAALQALLEEEGSLPVNIKFVIEGEEENKSHGLGELLKSKKEAFEADYLLAPDMLIPSLDAPAVTIGMRGILALNLTLTGSNTDLHSGLAGGVAYNPNHALVELLASLRQPDGAIAAEGFYDGIIPLSPEERASVNLEIDEGAFCEKFDAKPVGGEAQYSPGESVAIRPTLEINGIWGGYTGPGVKTVVPAKAHAKLSARLVVGQDPDKVAASIEKHLRSHLPKGMKLEVEHLGGEPALRTSPSHPHIQALSKAYSEVFNIPCQNILSGGSVPILASLTKTSGAPAAMMGLGLETDLIHAPNEHFGLDRLKLGFLLIATFMKNLGECL